jgi:hypothetical protein
MPARSRLTNPETITAKAGRGRRTPGDDRAQRAPKQAPVSRGPAQQHPARPRSGPQRPGSAHPGQRPGPPPGPQHL